jgi:hypothetical protein
MTNALGGGHARLLCWCSEELRQGGRVIEGKEAYEVAARFVEDLDIGAQHRCPSHKSLQWWQTKAFVDRGIYKSLAHVVEAGKIFALYKPREVNARQQVMGDIREKVVGFPTFASRKYKIRYILIVLDCHCPSLYEKGKILSRLERTKRQNESLR